MGPRKVCGTPGIANARKRYSFTLSDWMPQNEVLWWVSDQVFLSSNQHNPKTSGGFDFGVSIRNRIRTCGKVVWFSIANKCVHCSHSSSIPLVERFLFFSGDGIVFFRCYWNWCYCKKGIIDTRVSYFFLRKIFRHDVKMRKSISNRMWTISPNESHYEYRFSVNYFFLPMNRQFRSPFLVFYNMTSAVPCAWPSLICYL